MQIDGVRQLRIILFQLLELGDFPRLTMKRSRRGARHPSIVHYRPGRQQTAGPPHSADGAVSACYTGRFLQMPSLSVLMIASEAQPYAKTCGLADVAGALPHALARLGHDVTLTLPRYRGSNGGVAPEAHHRLQIGRLEFEVGYAVRDLTERVRIVLIDCPELYDREFLYGRVDEDYPDNAMRFALLTHAALEWVVWSRQALEVVHVHDWQGGLAPVYLATTYRDHPAFNGTATVFTIHNLAYQGLFPAEVLADLDLSPELYTVDGLESWGCVSFLKGGINFSDAITTVSPQYAKEILTPDLGFGFDGVLTSRRDDLEGILNGIDEEVWNPATDPWLPARYSAEELGGKQAAKQTLLDRCGFSAGGDDLTRPLIGLISRLIDQKGFDLLAALEDELPRLGASWIVLGSGERRHEEYWTELARRHPDRIAVRIGFDEPLAHLIEAGADIFLMPSRFEPCELNQMYSLRYGTVPVVRACDRWTPRHGDAVRLTHGSRQRLHLSRILRRGPAQNTEVCAGCLRAAR